MDLQSIKTKLVHTVNALGQSDANVQVDWGGEPQRSRSAAGPRPGVDFSAAVDALQWRSEPYSPTPSAPPVSPEMHLKRLNAMAGKINHLSAEQERAIAEMQAIQAHLSRLQPRLNGQGLPLASPSLDVKRAAIASAEVDSQGNILLSYRTVNPSQGPQSAAHPRPNSEAADLAAHLRATYGPAAAVPGGWRALAADVLAVGQEPAQLVARLGQATWEMAQGLTRFALSGATQPPGAPPRPRGNSPALARPSLSGVDAVLWFGGGVIGRVALNLLLAAFPALWSVAVAAITAVTAYALYRATLAPKLAFGPAIRVFLLVVGLVVGGPLLAGRPPPAR